MRLLRTKATKLGPSFQNPFFLPSSLFSFLVFFFLPFFLVPPSLPPYSSSPSLPFPSLPSPSLSYPSFLSSFLRCSISSFNSHPSLPIFPSLFPPSFHLYFLPSSISPSFPFSSLPPSHACFNIERLNITFMSNGKCEFVPRN